MDSSDNDRQTTIRQVADLEEEAVLATVQSRLQADHDPLEIVQDCQEGLRQIGVRYEQREYFISALIMADEIFRQVMGLVQPAITEQHHGNDQGRILLGTVAGDIHDIGKNNLRLLLECYGFT
ncbi:MAG: cobalamin B12-binding domain-containing protein, partial [Chloroflexota bacterium]